MIKEELKIEKIPIDSIFPDENQPRKYFDEEEIISLANSIKKQGLIQPIIVRKKGDRYIIIAGERRYRAVKYLEELEIDCIVKTSHNYRIISLIENIQREDLKPIEEANAIKSLIDDNCYTHSEIADIIGKSRPYVTNKLRLLKLDPATKKMLNDGKITEGHARALLQEKNEDRRKKLAKKILEGKLNVRKVEKSLRKNTESKSEEIENIENILEDYLSTKVEIDIDDAQGTIKVDFYSEDQLNEILNKIYKE